MEKIVTKIGDVTIERRVSKAHQSVASVDPPPGSNLQQSTLSGPNNNPQGDVMQGHQPWQMNYDKLDLPMSNKNVPVPHVRNNILNSLHQGGNFDLKSGISIKKQNAGNYSEYSSSFLKGENAKLQDAAHRVDFNFQYTSNPRADANLLQGKDDGVTLPKMPRIDESHRQPFPIKVSDNQPKNFLNEPDLSKYSGISIERRKRIDVEPSTAKPTAEEISKSHVLNPSMGVSNFPLIQQPVNVNNNLGIQPDDDFSEDEYDDSYDEEDFDDENIGFEEELEEPEDLLKAPEQIDITDDDFEKLETIEDFTDDKASVKEIDEVEEIDDEEDEEEKGVEMVKLDDDEQIKEGVGEEEEEEQQIKNEIGDELLEEGAEAQESVKEEQDLVKAEEEDENENGEKDADITDLVELMQKGEIEGEIEDVKEEEILSDSENKNENGKRKAEDDEEGEEEEKKEGEEGDKKDKPEKGKSVRKKKKTENKKDGEKKEEGKEDNDGKEDIDKSKVTNANLRKNIREVMDETKLDEATLSAQRQEAERLKRLQEQQRIIREVQRQIALNRQNQKSQNKVLSLLQGNSQTSILKTSSAASQAHSTQTKSQNSVLVKLSNGEQTSLNNKRMIELLKSSKNKSVIGKPPISKTLLKQGLVTPSVTIAPITKKDPVVEDKKKSIVTISSDSEDDCIVLSDEDESEPEEDPTNSGMHTNDKYNLPDEKGRVIVNVGHPESESDLYLAPQIARIIKPHQIGGIRFLYDNVIESTERFSSSTGFGCILAHSMGLGKTLQIVSFSDIFLRYTSAKTILCIMPINTIQNWLAEFNMWLPKESCSEDVRCREFDLFIVNESLKNLHSRAKVILDWQKSGGVLLMGYELFRLLSLKKSYKSKKKKKDVEEENARNKELIEEVYSALVIPGPDLVICDEGHRIKNSHATTSQALKQIRTKRRIVLTGYPLQNNLLEYWCMVDFVRPNYLGTKTEFSNMFERPIQNGQCIDSTPQDKRLMRYRAHVLHSLLEGFVQRRSHAVLQSTLPEKEEYVLLLRFTPFQRKLYDTFMNEVVRTVTVPNPLKAFAVCCKIWNHPDVLYNFLKKKGEEIDLDLEEALPPSHLQIPQYPYGQQSAGPDGMNPQNPMMGTAPWPRRGPGSRGGKVRQTAGRRTGRGRKPAATIPPNVIGGHEKGGREGEGFGQFNPGENYGGQNEGMDNFQGRTTFNQNQFGFGNEYNSQSGYPGANYNKTPPANMDGMSGNSFQNKRFFPQSNETVNSNQYGNPQSYGHGTSDSNFSSNESNVNRSGFESNMNASEGSYNQNDTAKPYDYNPDFESEFYSNSGFPNPGPNANYSSENKNSGGGYQSNPTYFPNPGFRNDSYNYPTAGSNMNPGFQGYDRQSSSFQNTASNPNFQGNSGTNYQSSNDGFPGSSHRMQGGPVGHSPGYQNSIQDSNPGNFRSNYQTPESNFEGNRSSNSSSFRGQSDNPPFHGSSSSFDGNRSGNYQTQNPSASFQGPNPSPNFQGQDSKYPGQNTSSSFQGQDSKYPVQNPSSNFQGQDSKYPVQNTSSTFQGQDSKYPVQNPSSNFQGQDSKYPVQNPNSNFQGQDSKYPVQNPNSNFQGQDSKYPVQNPSSNFQGQDSKYPVQNTSSTFQGQDSKYPVQNTSTSFQGQDSKYPVQNPNSNFQGQDSKYPVQNTSTSFQGQDSKYPVQNPSPNFQGQDSKYPVQNTSSTFQGQDSKYPVQNPSSSFQGQDSKYPVQNTSTSFQGQDSKYPVQNTSSTFQGQDSKYPVQNTSPNYQGQGPSSNFQNQNPSTKFLGQSPSFPGQDPTPKFQGQATSPNYPNQAQSSNYQGQNVSSKFQDQNPGSNFQGQNSSSNFSGQNQSSNFQGSNYGQGFWPQSDWGTCGYPETAKGNTDFGNSGNSNSTTSDYMSQKFNSLEEEQDVKNENKAFSGGSSSDSVYNKVNCDYPNFGKSESDSSKFPEFPEENKVNKTKEEDEEKKEDMKSSDTTIKKEDTSLPYDWATDLFKNYITGVLENSSKMEVFFHIVTESIKLGDRLLLFSQSLLTLDLIEDYLHRRNVPDKDEVWAKNKNYFRLDGSTPGLEREKLINEFNANPGIHLFLVSTRAGSLGINLVGANRVVVFDASWNPCHDTQAVCRVYRYGQQKPCFVYRLVMDSCLEKKIYDRQVNKQGMADRVVDELNPDAHLSIKEVTNLCWDDQEDTTVKDFSHLKDKYNDEIIKILLDRCSKLLSKEPFQHESLLIDRKEKKLSQAEKRLAKRSYELEKQAANQPKNIYSFFPNSGQRGFVKPIASVRPMQSEIGSRGITPQLQNRSKWIPAEVWQKQGMSAQEMTLPLDVVIPTSSPEKTSIVLKAGQRVMVLKSPKGIYMQLENGKIIAIRSAFKVGQNGPGGSNKQDDVKKDTATSMTSTVKTNTNVGITSKVSQTVRPALMKSQQQQSQQQQQQFLKSFPKVQDKKGPVNVNIARSRQVMGKAKPFMLNRKYESVAPDIKQRLLSGKMGFGNQEDKFNSGQQQHQHHHHHHQQQQHQHQHHQHQHQHQQQHQHQHSITEDVTSMDERVESKTEESSFSTEEKMVAPLVEKTEEKRDGKTEMNDSLETLRKVTESIPDAAKREDTEGESKYPQMNPMKNYRPSFTSQTKVNPPDLGEKNRESEREVGEAKTGGSHATSQQQGGEGVQNWLMNQSYPPMDPYGNYFPGYYSPYGPGPGHMMPPYDGFYPPSNFSHPMGRNSSMVPPLAKQPATDTLKSNPQPPQPIPPNPATQNIQTPTSPRSSQGNVNTPPMYPPYPNPYPYPYNYHGNPSFNNQGFPFPNQSQPGQHPPSSIPSSSNTPTQGQSQSNPYDNSMYSAFHRPDAPPFQAPENPYPAPYPRPPYPNTGTPGFFPYNPPYPPNYPYGHNFNPYMHPPGYGYPMQNPPHLNQSQNSSLSNSNTSNVNRSNSNNASVS